MPRGSLENHLFRSKLRYDIFFMFENSDYIIYQFSQIKIKIISYVGSLPLPWSIRMKIALGAAQGLAFLHEEAERPVIYRDFKTSNILLDAVSIKDYDKITFFFYLFVGLIFFRIRTTMRSSRTLVLPKMVQKVIKPTCLLE